MEVSEQDLAAYALSKQLPTIYSLESNYGSIELDEELRRAVVNALEPIFRRRYLSGGAA